MKETIEGFALSPGQEHLWKLLQDSQSWNYRVQLSVLMEGEIDLQRSKEAVRSVVQRNEILRTTFQRLNSMSLPVQVIGESDAYSYKYYDLCGLKPADQEVEIDAVYQQIMRMPFDAERDDPLHMSMLILSPQS